MSQNLEETHSIFLTDVFNDYFSRDIVITGGCFTTPLQFYAPLEKVDNFALPVVDRGFALTLGYLQINGINIEYSKASHLG